MGQEFKEFCLIMVLAKGHTWLPLIIIIGSVSEKAGYKSETVETRPARIAREKRVEAVCHYTWRIRIFYITYPLRPG